MAAKITVEMLERAGACDSGLASFRWVFGEEAEITPENVEKALTHGFARNSSWLGLFLNETGRKEFSARSLRIPHNIDRDGVCTGCSQEFHMIADLLTKKEYQSEEFFGV